MANDFDAATVAIVYDKLTKAGVTKGDAAIIAGQWVISQAGKDLRVFSYGTALAQVEAACAAQFNRTFAHLDWKDGESVVQAEETTVEEGFNKRFHAIEHDLDALGTDVKKAFQCLAELRATLKGLLEELRTEINRINKDIYDCCKDDGRSVFVPPNLNTYYPPLDYGRYVGMIDIYGRPMQLWETKGGTIVLPLIPPGGGGDPWDDPRIKRASELSRVLNDNTGVKKLFNDARRPVTKERFVKEFGEDLSPGGVKVKDLVAILPAKAQFRSAADMLSTVVEREAAAIRTSGTSLAARTAAFGIGTDVPNMTEAPLDQFAAIPRAQRTALVAAGITTLGELSTVEAGTINAALKKGGVAATPGEVGGWQAMAQTMILSG